MDLYAFTPDTAMGHEKALRTNLEVRSLQFRVMSSMTTTTEETMARIDNLITGPDESRG